MASMNGSTTSLKHQNILQQFRKYVESITKEQVSDEFLLRRLRAKNFNLRKAEKLFLFGINVRKTYQLDSIVETYVKPEVIRKYEFAAFLGFEKDGTPIQYVPLEQADFYGFVNSVSTFDICIYCSYCIELLINLQKKRNKEMGRDSENTISVIFDMKNFSLQQFTSRPVIEASLDLMKMFQEEYPGLLNHVFVISAPVYFAAIFNIFKPILKMDIIEKIIVSSEDSSTNELLKHIDTAVLPAFLGGEKVDEDGDPKCSSFLKFGWKIPEECYGKSLPMLQLSDPEVQEDIIPPRITKDITISIEEARSRLHIELRSDKTIGLSILYRRTEKMQNGSFSENSDDIHVRETNLTEELISPYSKIQCHSTPIDSIIHCARAGIYIFRFDNTFSWMASKHIVYRIRALPPL